MGHKRKDTVSQSPIERKKHLRPWDKRRVAKNERRAAKESINIQFLAENI